MSMTTFRTGPAPIATAPVPAPPDGAAGPAGRAPRFATLTTTVPKELVHRASVAEVLLTDWARTAADRFEVSAQWPRGHSFFTAVQGRHDPLIAAESFRQAAILLAHTEFGVPLEHPFLMHSLTLDVRPEHLATGSAPASVGIEMTCHDVTWRRGAATAIRFEAVFRRGGQTVASASGSCTCTTPAVYARLRGKQAALAGVPAPLTAPLAPQHVGRTSPADVVLSPAGRSGRWLLRTDTSHPVLFDHQVDHVPGMVLLEAARQATVATLGQDTFVAHLASTFERYAELDTPCTIEAHPLPDHAGQRRVRILAHQNDTPVFTATTGTGPHPA
ncbi:ScbA/BarX family gamma-butyrolactone biosynthesis protein [Streptomyces sp. NBC_00568]|uniref:ScbA/BarX family gamma-butyrolactone biosynthesis protein n=2 Tax=Streptomyces TaxID=1883 RepID=UPI0022509B14|nr:ScbA/BarX family gamma-butyrolactone biosynthesis protein [Streptomyces sp. NBC_00568]MCX4993161.1 ScbA/BarX family gamma-butyrolactone biosynthesis protein [Streptomyces sp. NBC_00568]